MKNTIENHNLIETSGTRFPTPEQIVGDMPPAQPDIIAAAITADTPKEGQ